MNIALQRYGTRGKICFYIDLDDPKDLSYLHTIVHESPPDRLCSFLSALLPPGETRHTYAIDVIKDAYFDVFSLPLPERAEREQLLRDILCVTFESARQVLRRAWEETMAVFQTTDLKQLTKLHTALKRFAQDKRATSLDEDDFFSRFGVHTLSGDALEVLRRREAPDTPLRAVRAKILNVARDLAGPLDIAFCIDRRKNQTLYRYSDTDGNTITHFIASGTLFPGVEQIDFDPIEDRDLLRLRNLAGKTVSDVYYTRLKYGLGEPPTVSM
jgi:hypothetical protein